MGSKPNHYKKNIGYEMQVKPRKDRGREWSDVAVSPRMTGPASNHPKLEGGKGFFPRAFREITALLTP